MVVAPDILGHMNNPPSVTWNPNVKLICADVDQTVADDFMPAEPEMIHELNAILSEGIRLFFVTGGPLTRLRTRVIDQLNPQLRQHVLVSHCSGAEVWGFNADGGQHEEPFYSVYDSHMTEEQKTTWRQVVDELVAEFKLKKYPPQPVEQFRGAVGDDPLSIIYEDRGPQITLEVINGYDMTESQHQAALAQLPNLEEVVDLREPMLTWIANRLKRQGVPVTPRLAGVFALDLALEGVSKTQSVERVLASEAIMGHLGLSSAVVLTYSLQSH